MLHFNYTARTVFGAHTAADAFFPVNLRTPGNQVADCPHQGAVFTSAEGNAADIQVFEVCDPEIINISNQVKLCSAFWRKAALHRRRQKRKLSPIAADYLCRGNIGVINTV